MCCLTTSMITRSCDTITVYYVVWVIKQFPVRVPRAQLHRCISIQLPTVSYNKYFLSSWGFSNTTFWKLDLYPSSNVKFSTRCPLYKWVISISGSSERERVALPEGPSDQEPFYRMAETDPVSRVRGCETWYFTLREEHRIRVFENRVPRRMFGPTRDEVTGTGRGCRTRNFMICTPHQILFGCWNTEEWNGWDVRHVWGTGEVRTRFWRGNLRERVRLEDLGVGRRIILKWTLNLLGIRELDLCGSE